MLKFHSWTTPSGDFSGNSGASSYVIFSDNQNVQLAVMPVALQPERCRSRRYSIKMLCYLCGNIRWKGYVSRQFCAP